MASRFEQLSREELVQEATRLQQALDKEKKLTAAYSEELKRQREQNLAVVGDIPDSCLCNFKSAAVLTASVRLCSNRKWNRRRRQ